MRRQNAWMAVAAVVTLALSGCAAGGSDPAVGPPGLPTDTAWAELPESPLSARRASVGAWLGDRFVVVGGWSDQPCQDTGDCEYTEPAQRDGASFNPYTGVWARIAPAPLPVSQYSSTVVNGDLYLFAYDGQLQVSFLRYDPETDAWTRLPPPPSGGALVAAGDRVLSIAGSDENVVGVDAVFHPDSLTWTALPDDPLGPSYDREAVWLGASLLIAAKALDSIGADGPAPARMATLDGDFTSWSVLSDTEVTGIGPLAVAGLVVFPFYGTTERGVALRSGERPVAEGGVFNPADQTWTALPDLPAGTQLTEYANGRPPQALGDQVLIGGQFLLNPVTREVTALPPQSWDNRTEATVITGPDSVLVWGGATYDDEDGSVANRANGYLLGL
jgi:hypothetical protein